MGFSEPLENLKHLHFPNTGTVVDFGSGSGQYVFALAERMRDHKGLVIAVDIQRELLAKLTKEAEHRHLDNVHMLWGDAEEIRGTTLPDESADAAIVSNILFQLSEKGVFVQEVRRVLRHDGEVLVIDWIAMETKSVEKLTQEAGAHSMSLGKSDLDIGPAQSRRISEQDTRNLFERHGFSLRERFNAGNHHFGLIFRKERGTV